MEDTAELAKKLRLEVTGIVEGSDEEGYHVAYIGTDKRSKTMRLEAETYDDAVFEAVSLLCD